MLNSRDDVHDLLKTLGAPRQLLKHLELVGAVADELAAKLIEMDVSFDDNLVRLGAACHDAGKIIHIEELGKPGSLHEVAGEKLLLEFGASIELARFCRSHAQYNSMETSYEELLVALADKLWKGKRVASLELRVIDSTAARLDQERWDLFEELDETFEKIAAHGDKRLIQTMA